jgi:hypothetical protein
MFAGIIHPDGIGRGICNECHRTGKDVERWKRLDKESALNAEVSEVAVAGATKTSGVRPPLSLD